jgi:hypothetical protein
MTYDISMLTAIDVSQRAISPPECLWSEEKRPVRTKILQMRDPSLL